MAGEIGKARILLLRLRVENHRSDGGIWLRLAYFIAINEINIIYMIIS